MEKVIYDGARIPSGMHLSVAFGDTPLTLHPVRDVSLTGCKRGGTWNYLPRDAFVPQAKQTHWFIHNTKVSS